MTRTGLMYVVAAQAQGLIGDSFIQMGGSSATPFVVHWFYLASDDTTRVKRRLRLVGNSGIGTGGIAQTEVPLHTRNAVAADTAVKTNVTDPASVIAVYENLFWDTVTPFEWMPAPKDRLYMSAGGVFGIDNPSGLSLGTVSIAIAWEEL